MFTRDSAAYDLTDAQPGHRRAVQERLWHPPVDATRAARADDQLLDSGDDILMLPADAHAAASG